MIACAALALALYSASAGVVRHNRVGTGDGRPLASIVLNPNIQACGNIALDFADNRQPAWAAPCPEPSE